MPYKIFQTRNRKPRKIESFLSNISFSVNIQSEVQKVAENGTKCKAAFTSLLMSDGNMLLTRKTALEEAGQIKRLDVAELESLLESMTSGLKSIKNDVINIQDNVKGSVGNFQSRKRQHETSRFSTQDEIKNLEQEITSSEQELASCQEDIVRKEQAAEDLNEQAVDQAATDSWNNFYLGAGVGAACYFLTGGQKTLISCLL